MRWTSTLVTAASVTLGFDFSIEQRRVTTSFLKSLLQALSIRLSRLTARRIGHSLRERFRADELPHCLSAHAGAVTYVDVHRPPRVTEDDELERVAIACTGAVARVVYSRTFPSLSSPKIPAVQRRGRPACLPRSGGSTEAGADTQVCPYANFGSTESDNATDRAIKQIAPHRTRNCNTPYMTGRVTPSHSMRLGASC